MQPSDYVHISFYGSLPWCLQNGGGGEGGGGCYIPLCFTLVFEGPHTGVRKNRANISTTLSNKVIYVAKCARVFLLESSGSMGCLLDTDC